MTPLARRPRRRRGAHPCSSGPSPSRRPATGGVGRRCVPSQPLSGVDIGDQARARRRNLRCGRSMDSRRRSPPIVRKPRRDCVESIPDDRYGHAGPRCRQTIISQPAGATLYASVRYPGPIQNPNFGWFSFGPMSRARFQCDEGGSTRGNDDRVCSLVLVIDRERSPRGSEARSKVRLSLATIR